MQPENTQPESDGIERELTAAKLADFGHRVVGPFEHQVARSEGVDGDAPGQLGDVQLERVPDAALAGESARKSDAGHERRGGTPTYRVCAVRERLQDGAKGRADRRARRPLLGRALLRRRALAVRWTQTSGA